MEYFLSAYAIQGVTGVRFMFNVLASPSTALTGPATISSAWVTRLSNFFNDLAAFGITKITPTPSWDDFGAANGTATCAPTLSNSCTSSSNCTPSAGGPGRTVQFSALMPYGAINTGNGYVPDDQSDNNAYSCSPKNPGFWGWSSHYAVINAVAGAARSAGLTIEEIDLQNEVDLYNFDVQARMLYDNTTNTPVLKYLGGALSNNGFSPTAVTVSVDTNSPQYLTVNYPCGSVYGDAAQVLPSSELLAALGGAAIGTPPFITPNGQMSCDNSVANGCPSPSQDPAGWEKCATKNMISIPTQGSALPTVTDMHAKPCIVLASGDCDDLIASGANTSNTLTAASATFTYAWDFLLARGLTSNDMMFGETWANSHYACNGYPDYLLTAETVTGYQQSSLAADGGNVVFRPWGNDGQASTVCETPLNIGAPSGAYKQ